MDSSRANGERHIPLATILLFQLSSLLVREWLRASLTSNGLGDRSAAHFSGLGGLAVFTLLLLPLRDQLLRRLKPTLRCPPSWSIAVIRGVAIGVTMRLAGWSMMIALVSLGWPGLQIETPGTTLLLWWQCPPVPKIILGVIALVIATPLVEECVNRGVILGELRARQVPQPAATSALLFAIFHVLHTMPIAFLFGIVMARLVTIHHSLWPALFAHATFNALVILDWYCLQGVWLPAERSALLALLSGGATLVFVLVALRLAGWGNRNRNSPGCPLPR